MRVGSRELKLHLGKYLGRVRAGETIEITDRGKPVARLSPVPRQELPPRLQQLVVAGQATYEPGPLVLPTPVEMSRGVATAVDYVREQRR
jgi:prevent-host-death family protein